MATEFVFNGLDTEMVGHLRPRSFDSLKVAKAYTEKRLSKHYKRDDETRFRWVKLFSEVRGTWMHILNVEFKNDDGTWDLTMPEQDGDIFDEDEQTGMMYVEEVTDEIKAKEEE